MKNTIDRLSLLLETIPEKFKILKENDWNCKPSPNKWSKKEILGHLIDSAANNHQRFIRVQFEEKPTILYDHVNWNHFNHHNTANTDHLMDLWISYNRFLINPHYS